MSKIKLTGSNSGYVEIDSAADAGNLTLTLPTSGIRLLSNTDNVFSGITTTGELDINGKIDVSTDAVIARNLSVGGITTHTGTTTLSDDVTFTGASYNVLWDKSDNQLEFADNAKLSFGADADLQIYHTGSGSVILHGASSGQLTIGSDDALNLTSRTGTEYYFRAYPNNRAELYYDFSTYNTPKLQTSATGVTVNGICAATSFSGSGEGLTRTTPYSHRNLIINGQFLVWQRATDSGSNTTDGYLTCDRWYHASSGATKQVTRQTFSPGQTDVPDNPFYYLRYAVTTGNNNVALRQRVEDVTRCQGEMTLSFWVKGSNPGGGQFNLTFRQDFGSSGSSVVDTSIANYTVSNTWTKKTFTFTPASISGKTVSGNKHTSFYEIELFRQPAGDTSTAAFTVDFANVQLERGSVATPFEQKHLADEFRACQRYYQVFGNMYSYRSILGLSINGNSSTVIEVMPNFKVDLRATPTISVSGSQLEARAGISGSANITLAGNNMSHQREYNQVSGHMWFSRSSGDAFSVGASGRIFASSTATINFDAEL